MIYDIGPSTVLYQSSQRFFYILLVGDMLVISRIIVEFLSNIFKALAMTL